MEYRAVANTALEVSAIGLGTVDFGKRLDSTASCKLVEAEIDAGITLFDTGDNDCEADRKRSSARPSEDNATVSSCRRSSPVATDSDPTDRAVS